MKARFFEVEKEPRSFFIYYVFGMLFYNQKAFI